jgi:hypothetical protein
MSHPRPDVFERSLSEDVSDLMMYDAGHTPSPAVITITIMAALE